MRLRLLPLLIAPLLAALMWVESPRDVRANIYQEGQAQPDDEPAVPDGMEVQARGPVHEAYAEPSNGAPTPGPLVDKEPPADIEEAPPEEKPEGDDVVWVPGYWGWDEESKEYLWVSGFWRVSPPGRTWTPGHWQKVAEGHQWVAGYWAEAQAAEGGKEEQEQQPVVELLPEPPETIDQGPAVPAPAVDYHYVPGIWVFRVSRFVWRPGFWWRHRPGWVWINARYRWTPAGYIYVNSYYDVPILDRGLLCAPVRFTQPIFARRGFVHRPAHFVQPDFLVGSLFVTARRPRYFFGNYFEPRYRDSHIAWNRYRVNRRVYDANYSYYRVTYAKYPAWERGLTALYAGRLQGTIARPPVTLVQQRKVANTFVANKTTNVVVNKAVNITNIQNNTVLSPLRRKTSVQVTALASLANLQPAAAPVRREVKMVEMTAARRKEELQQINRLRTISTQRRAADEKAAKTSTAATLKAPVRIKMDLPRTTPPPRRVVTTVKPPVAPKRPDLDSKVKPPAPRPKDKIDVPPPRPKDKDKIKDKPPIPRPKDKEKVKDKPPPRPKEKEKERPNPFPPRPKEKDKPPPRPKEKEKERPKPPPPPPRPMEKEKPKPPPPPPPPRPKQKEKPPSPPPPPRPREKEKDRGQPPPRTNPPPKPPTPPPVVVPPKVVVPPPRPTPPPPKTGNPPKEKPGKKG